MHLQLTYEIHSPPFPPSAKSPTLDSSKTLSYELNTTTSQSHLKSLDVALGVAREELNERLSEWKEALGQAGLEKEKPKRVGDGEDGEDGDDEE